MRQQTLRLLVFLVLGWSAATGQAQDPRGLYWLTEEEKAFLVEHPVIRVAPTPDYPPFEYWDENGKFSGVVSSYLNHIEKMLGIKFEMHRTEEWSENLAGLQSGEEFDAVSLLVPRKDREYVSVSKPYISYPAVLVVRSEVTEELSLKKLAGKMVAVPDGYTGEAFLRETHPDIRVIEVKDPTEGVELVTEGKVDAFFGGAAVAAYVAEREGINDLRIAGETDFNYQNGFGIRSDMEIFTGIFNKTLRRIPEGQRIAFHAEWVSDDFFEKRFYEHPRFWWAMGLVLASLLLGTTAMGVWNRKQAAFIDQLEIEKQKTDQARKEAEAANEAKSQFVAMISHEIRTPMNGVLGMCELLRGTGLAPKQTEYLDCASGSAENLVELINDILDFSKMEAGKLELDEQPFSLTRVVDEVATLMKTQTDRKGLTLAVTTDKNLLPYYVGDSLRIRQILLNLLSNAIKFTHVGEVAMKVRCLESGGENHLVEFEVEDSGIGIATDKLQRIFEPFEQEELSTTRRYGGTGLGLSICKTLAEMMGGTAEADSEPGKGSRFRFSVRIKPADAVPESEAAMAGSPSSRTCHVLLAEDGIVNQKVAVGLLEQRGHRVDVVTTGIAALEAIDQGSYDVVLMDIEMPEMDGLTAVTELRKQESGTERHQWVVAMTGHAMAGDRERFMAAGMDSHLVKPFKPADLFAAVEKSPVVEHKNAISDGSKPAAGVSLIDEQAALETTGGNRDLAKILLQTCIDETPAIFEQARKAIGADDFVTARRCGHSLKSSFGAVGAVSASQLADELEFCESTRREDFEERLEKIEAVFARIVAEY